MKYILIPTTYHRVFCWPIFQPTSPLWGVLKHPLLWSGSACDCSQSNPYTTDHVIFLRHIYLAEYWPVVSPTETRIHEPQLLIWLACLISISTMLLPFALPIVLHFAASVWVSHMPSSSSYLSLSLFNLFYIWCCKFPCYSLHTTHPVNLPSPSVPKSVLYVCFSIAALHINSSVPSF